MIDNLLLHMWQHIQLLTNPYSNLLYTNFTLFTLCRSMNVPVPPFAFNSSITEFSIGDPASYLNYYMSQS